MSSATHQPMNIELWGAPYSTCTQRIMFTLEELGGPQTPFQFHIVNMMKGEHKDPAYVQKRQPFGKVPAAEIDGQAFYESRAVARIIAEFSSHSNLMPRDLKNKAVFEQWASLEYGTYNIALSGIVAERVFKPMYGRGVPDETEVKKLHGDAQTAWKILDTQLSSNEYVTGQFSLVDIFLTPYFQHFSTTPEGKEVLTQHANVGKWWERVSARPAWKKCLQDAQEARKASH